ncbi:hydroxylamine reductase [Aquisphaera insulae]|uniref:hydroxylamine reductase n=1 Tax=Aquisphaera insulae TaxID=2712864 RepID=UPI0013ECE6EB|nr:hydroxylamine reductase [Aquisphaera insulae]
MFCNQCEQTAHGTGCVISPGVCGKDADVQSVQEMILFGLKGMAAYANHARRLGKTDESVSAFIEEALFATMTNVNFDLGSLLEIALELGRKNLRVMELLDAGHIEAFGRPSPTIVSRGTKPGPGILVTGHDLVDLHDLLKQVEGTGINVYTHGEMLPAFMYPTLREHPNLAGHYGGPWQKQKQEFPAFPGPVVATTNCILIPRADYADRVFTTRFTAVPGGTRLATNDFSAVLAKARTCPPLEKTSQGAFQVGFHRTVLLDAAPTIVEAVKAGRISRFFVIGGCDGAEPGRNYFSDYARNTPPDSFIFTLGCGKYRINGHDYGEHLGLPRLMDMGQCNDAYGAIQVALALAEAFSCGVNDLPLTLVVSWFEQKAVAVLLTLLSLGVKGITLGPNPPAFVTPNVFRILQEQFDLKLTGADAKQDLLAVLN